MYLKIKQTFDFTDYQRVFLYLWAITIGLPQIAYNFKDIVNIRLDDIILLLLFISTLFFNKKANLNKDQKLYYFIFISLTFYIIFSIIITYIIKGYIYLYPVFRFFGITIAFFTIYKIIKTETQLLNLLKFMCIGGLLICLNVIFNIYNIAENYEENINNFRYLKVALSPETWNANTIGTYLYILIGFSYILYKKIKNNIFIKILFFILTIIFTVIPIVSFNRTAVIGTITFYTVLILLKRDKIIILNILAIIACIYMLYMLNPIMLNNAINDMYHGSSIETRTYLWNQSINIIKNNPLGVGFSREKEMFEKTARFGMSHNDLLSSYLELGIFGGTIFCITVLAWPYIFLKKKYKLYKYEDYKYILLSQWAGLIVISFAMPSIYYCKPSSYIFSIYFTYLGLNNKNM